MQATEHDKLLSLGFTYDEVDPIYPYCFSLNTEPTDADDEKLDLLIGPDTGNGQYSLVVGSAVFLNLAFESPEEAIKWTEAITGFEHN